MCAADWGITEVSQSSRSPGKLELVVVQLGNDDRLEMPPLVEERDQLACQRIRPIQRRRLFRFRRLAVLTLLERLRSDATVLRDAAGHIRALLDASGMSYVSTSASGPVCAMAICDKSVGIDIEHADSRVDLVSILEFVNAPFAASIKALPPHIAAFEARIAWTRLEAGLKRVACGIHDYITGKPATLLAGQGPVHVLATLDWVCAVVHPEDSIEIIARHTDFEALCGE